MPHILCDSCGRPITAKGARLAGRPREEMLSIGLAVVGHSEPRLDRPAQESLERLRAAERAAWTVPPDAAAIYEADLRRRLSGVPSRDLVALGNVMSAWLQETEDAEIARSIDDALVAAATTTDPTVIDGILRSRAPATRACAHRAVIDSASWTHGDPLAVLASGKQSTAKLKKLSKTIIATRVEHGPLYCVYFAAKAFDVVELAFEPPSRSATTSRPGSLSRFLAVASSCRLGLANGKTLAPLFDASLDASLRADPALAKRLGAAVAISMEDPDITVLHPGFADALGEPVITTLVPGFKKPRSNELKREGFGHYVLDQIATFVDA